MASTDRVDRDARSWLETNCTQINGHYYFNDDLDAPYSETRALQIIKAALLLGLTPTNFVTGEAWLVLVTEVVRLRERMDRLERKGPAEAGP